MKETTFLPVHKEARALEKPHTRITHARGFYKATLSPHTRITHARGFYKATLSLGHAMEECMLKL
jgi:elongation factor P hydroxylase